MGKYKKLLLHIGQHKTGTSSVQRFFDQASESLHACNVLYPELGRSGSKSLAPGHHQLAQALHRRVNRGESQEFTDLIAGINNEFDVSGANTMLISSEDIYTCPRPEIVQWVFPDFEIEIYVSLRPQHEMIGAMYYTAATGEKFDMPPEDYYEQRLPAYCDYLTRMDMWRRDFPDARIHLRSYDKGQAVRKDAVADILEAFKLPISQADLPPIEREHPTLPARGQQILRAAVRLGLSPDDYFLLFRALHKERPSLGSEMSVYAPSYRAMIHEKYRDSNRQIRRKYGDGEDADLFTDPPEGDDAAWAEDVGDILKVAREYIVDLARRRLRDELDVDYG